jgi:hypothetical protein
MTIEKHARFVGNSQAPLWRIKMLKNRNVVLLVLIGVFCLLCAEVNLCDGG